MRQELSARNVCSASYTCLRLVVHAWRALQAQLLEVSLQKSSCIVSDGYHRMHATLTQASLDTFRTENPGETLSGTFISIQKARFQMRPEQV